MDATGTRCGGMSRDRGELCQCRMRAAVARPHQPVEPVSLGIRRHASVVRVCELPRNAAVWRRAGVVAGDSEYEAAVGAHGFPAGDCALRCGWVREAIGGWRCAVGVKRMMGR
jgi:hypothetical protein